MRRNPALLRLGGQPNHRNKAEIIRTCEAVLDECCAVEGLAAEYASLQTELEVVTGLMQRHISDNAHSALDQAEYQRQYDE